MNNYFCVLPYYSLELDFNRPDNNIYCCRLQHKTNIENVRTSINAHQKAKECQTCWQLEEKNMVSERILHNRTLDYLLDISIENIEKFSLQQGYNPKIVKLTTSNLCNGQCITCGPHYSSSWASLENKTSKYVSLDVERLDIDWQSIVSLSFVGGEPLLEKKNFLLLDKLVSLNNTNCFISIVTNGSIELTPYQINILEKFTNLNICLSIDGIESRFEYMRFPLKWSKLLENLRIFKTIAKHLSVSCMISNLNIFYYSELIDFFKDQKLDYLCKQITYPTIFQPGNLPENFKNAVKQNNLKYTDNINSFLTMGSNSNFDLFIKEVKKQDLLKQIQIENYMPEISKFFTNI